MFAASGKRQLKTLYTKMKKFLITCLGLSLCSINQNAIAQFAPPVGQAGTTAMYKDSTAFIDWATACIVTRGLQDTSDNSLGYANVGDETMALGMAGTNAVVSLGDGGYAVLQFSQPIADGAGPDFAVFENGFDDTFLELAFVEVSSDGVNYFRFPATSNTDTTVQTSGFGTTDATLINNLAGKYKALYGTPFDLAELPFNTLLNPMAITHVKIIDVIGSIQEQYCTRDRYNHKINDPWPTGFGSGGFDLDAVGVIHNQSNVGIKENKSDYFFSLFPNPAKEQLHINISLNKQYLLKITNILGDILMQTDSNEKSLNFTLESLEEGVYFISIESENHKVCKRFVKSSN